jgi:hypothetical protein
MNIDFRRILGTASAVAVLMGTGAAAVAAPAGAQPARPWPQAVAAAPQIATVIDLNGTYKDNGSGRPRITVTGDILTVDLSSQNRPPATGLVFDDHTILVIFPDVSAWFRGTLVAPGTILWSNNTIWQKLPYVPDVTGDSLKDAVAALKAAGFTAKTLQGPSCGSGPLSVLNQAPLAGTQADSGSQVRITMSNC